MVQIIQCKQCGNSHVDFGTTSITVNYSQTVANCNCCNNTNTEKWYDWFCSEKCFDKWRKSETPIAESPSKSLKKLQKQYPSQHEIS